MKKYLVSFAFAVLFFAGCKSDSGVDDLRKEIEALKSTEIASVNSQITGIKSSISDLQKVDAELKGYIKTLQDALTAPDSEIDEKYASLQKDIEDLKKADAALEKRISDLKDYCDQQNSSTREWVTTTFTTLEQHSEVLEEIAAIKLQLGKLGNSITTLDSSLSKKISDSEDKVMAAIGTTENSVKSWVNEQLSGYYTIAAADAKLKLLEDAYKAGDTSLAGDIKTLQDNLNTAKSDLTAAYQKAIADAITENNGTINKKIADDIKAAADNLQAQINAINTRIDALESRVAALEASVAELIGMVQSIVVVPDYSDGSVKMTSSSDNIIRFEVYPLSAAKALAEKGPSVFSLDYVETQTKAGSLINLPISAVYFDGEFVSIIADGSEIPENIAVGLTGANARLRILSGNVTNSSEYFRLASFADSFPVDLGLSVKWAAGNLGANTPEECGVRYAWGETETKEKTDFTILTYKWCLGTGLTFTKYNFNSDYGFVDNKTKLDAEDDAARVKLGGAWRMPTDDEIIELMSKCTCTYVLQKGVYGFLVKSYNGNNIFIPTITQSSSFSCMLLTSSLSTESPQLARCLECWYDTKSPTSIFLVNATRIRWGDAFIRPVTN